MPINVTWPNGQTLSSTANDAESLATIFQPVIAQILGYSTTPPAVPPDPQNINTQRNPYEAVRVGWQQTGQPSWPINTDVCIITARSEDAPFGQVSDEILANATEDLSRTLGYTQVWKVHFALYGPNSFLNAGLISVGISTQDWVNDILSAAYIYPLASWNRPINAPEEFDGQWWNRTDLEMEFNEQVTQITTELAAESVDITLVTDSGVTETIHVVA